MLAISSNVFPLDLTTAAPHFVDASVALDNGDNVAALDAVDRALLHEPQNEGGFLLAGKALLRAGKLGLAAHMFRMHLAANPTDGHAWCDLSAALSERHPRLAEQCLQSASQHAQSRSITTNMAGALAHRGEYDDAARLARAARKLPGATQALREARNVEAICHWARGEWREAWKEWAESQGSKYRPARFADRPQWDYKPVDRLLIYREQGVGDEIAFCSMLEPVRALAKQITIEVQPRLQRLFQASFPDCDIITEGDPIPDVDAVVPMGCIGLAGTFEPVRAGRYLSPPADLEPVIAKALESCGDKLKVGISWTGGRVDRDMAERSVPLKWLEPILAAGGKKVQFISLQYHDDEAEIADSRWPIMRLPELTAQGADLALSAALIDQLDLVISTPQTNVAVAGALGKPCWVLCPDPAPWHYTKHAGDNRWYWSRSPRIFRAKDYDYGPAIKAIAEQLKLRTG